MLARSCRLIIGQANPTTLKPHPKNSAIYGENEPIGPLVEHIRRSQWVKPPVVNQHNVIISGHRRWQAALELKLGAVPIERRQFGSETEEREALLLENATRDKTPEQRVREAEEWRAIEEEKAKQRQLANLRQGTTVPIVEMFPQWEQAGQSTDSLPPPEGPPGAEAP